MRRLTRSVVFCFPLCPSCEVREDVQEATGQPVRGGAEAPAAAAGAAAAERGGGGPGQGVRQQHQQWPGQPQQRDQRHLCQRARHRPAQVRGVLHRRLRPAVP